MNSKNLDALTASATIYERLGRLDDALGQLDRALALEPEIPALRTSRARILGMSGRHDEAIKEFAALARDYPDDGTYFQYLGDTYAIKKAYEPAVENLEKAARLHPTPTVFRHLAVCYTRMGRISDAVRSLEKFLGNPGDEPAAVIREARSELQRLRAASR